MVVPKRSGGDDTLKSMEAIPRWVGWTWLVGGALGIVATLVGLAVGVMTIDTTVARVQVGLGLVSDTVGAVDEAVATLDAGLDVAADSLRDVQGSAADAALTLTQISAVTRDLGELIGQEVPASIDAVRAAMPPLVDTARVVDRTMRALSLVGVDYDPAVPLDEALTEVDRRLADIPRNLRGRDRVIGGVADGLAGLGTQTLVSAEQMASVRSEIADASRRLDTLRGVGDRTRALIGSTTWTVEAGARRAQALVVLAAILALFVLSVPVVFGWAVVRDATTSRRFRRS